MSRINVVYGSTADTDVAVSNTTYLTARSATTVTAPGSASANVQNTFLTPNYIVGQAFLVFDTSAVPAGGISAYFSLDNSNSPASGNANSDAIRFRQASSTANKIAGASLAALTLHSDLGTVPTVAGRFTSNVISPSAIPRSTTFIVVVHTANEQAGTTPTGINRTSPYLADRTGTTNDPFLSITTPDWSFLGVSNVVEVITAAHALVTTGISGTLQAGDLLVACISSRIASTASITLPTGGEWTLVSEQKNNNILATTSAAASGLMAYCVRGASNPNLTFTHPVAPSVAIGRVVAYRNVAATSPLDAQTSFTTAIATTAVSGTGLTTTVVNDLIVAMAAGGQEAAWSAFDATDPVGASGATSTADVTTAWLERADSNTTTGVDTSLAIFDAEKSTIGATGNLTATSNMAAAHVVIAAAFKIAGGAATGTGTPAGQAGAASGAGISESTGTGTPAGQPAAVSGSAVSASAGTGALAAQNAVASGAGAVASTGTGALAAQAAAATVVGAGASASTGTGSLVAGSAEVTGTGTAEAANSGALIAQAATVSGAGLSASTGIGALQAGAAAIAGVGLVASVGSGDLVAGSAVVSGAGEVIAAGAVVGAGALVAGAATLSGEGEVIGEVAPPVSVGGGYWRPWRQPVAVEGIGYAILPQLEGEAHGFVVDVGAARAALPCLGGAAVGAVGVVGRSAARLTIRVAAVGERGHAGSGAGVITLKGAAVGQYDDDEAAMIALLLAA